MNFDYRNMVPEELDGSSRVWIYQAARLFSISEALQIEEMLNDFTASWTSHGTPVKGFASLFYGQFIVLMADEKASMVSGCSTDSSVRLIKQIETHFHVPMFDRQLLAFLVRGKVQLLPLSQLQHGASTGIIHPDTLYFNNTVLTKSDFEKNWIIPVSESWLSARIEFPDIISRQS